ncbi:hypothetical protein PtA15_10A81 [Puccinia triticina]|uniref:HMA domain-containing protein n=1 Tax=Puccinia triticina TaxID=208348 RepID=A0ABY7D122_9BASI|nr:uncharacterized protein PtA15_10A81 [Puccinia triticina]WAQ88662.1 hypothetical protein PtA15_10A81 [Puccinia triticina]
MSDAATASGPEQQYKFNVAMSCSGCSGAVERALKKQEGVSKIDISLETQTVLVHAHPPATFDIVREKIAKTGKTINSSERGFLTSGRDRNTSVMEWSKESSNLGNSKEHILSNRNELPAWLNAGTSQADADREHALPNSGVEVTPPADTTSEDNAEGSIDVEMQPPAHAIPFLLLSICSLLIPRFELSLLHSITKVLQSRPLVRGSA